MAVFGISQSLPAAPPAAPGGPPAAPPSAPGAAPGVALAMLVTPRKQRTIAAIVSFPIVCSFIRIHWRVGRRLLRLENGPTYI